MPAVFGTFDRTILVAFLATHGPTTVTLLAAAFEVHHASLVRRLQSAQRAGLVERVTTPDATWNCIDRNHPARAQILALAKKLGEIFTMPTLLRHRSKIPKLRKTAREPGYDIVDVFGNRSQSVRAELLLFLGALGEPIPISRLSGALARYRYSIFTAINGLEAFGIIRSTRRGHYRRISLDNKWEAYREILRLIRRLNAVDTTYADIAAAYCESGGSVAYKL